MDHWARHRMQEIVAYRRLTAGRRRVRSSESPRRARSRASIGLQRAPKHDPCDPDAVRRVVAALLTRRSPDIHLVADTMLLSPRTLQRRLHSAGLTYAQLIAEARRSSAERLLADRSRTIGDVARTLGYSDPAHFTRAFQRWTGLTPRAFRVSRADVDQSDRHRRR